MHKLCRHHRSTEAHPEPRHPALRCCPIVVHSLWEGAGAGEGVMLGEGLM